MEKYIVKITTENNTFYIRHESPHIITSDINKALIFTDKKKAYEKGLYFRKYVLSEVSNIEIIKK